MAGAQSLSSISPGRPRTLKAILWGGLICGTMDITAAFIVYGQFGATPWRILKGIAGGILGPDAYNGGLAIALLGLCLHYTIAFGATTAFVLVSRVWGFLTRQAVIAGVLYGPVVYWFMQLVVIPLSLARRSPFSWKMTAIGIAIHVFCVGLPISLATRRIAGGSAQA